MYYFLRDFDYMGLVIYDIDVQTHAVLNLLYCSCWWHVIILVLVWIFFDWQNCPKKKEFSWNGAILFKNKIKLPCSWHSFLHYLNWYNLLYLF